MDVIDEWTAADGTKYRYGRAPEGTDSELSNGDDTYAHTYASRPGCPEQGDTTLPGRVGQPGIEQAVVDNITVITDFPAFKKVTGVTYPAEQYLKEVAEYYRAWSEGKQYWVESDGETFDEFVEAGPVDRAYIESRH